MSWEVQRAGDLPKPMNDDGPRLSRPRFTRHALLLNCLFPTRQDEDETRPADTVLCLPQPQGRPPEDTKLLLIFGFTGQQMHHMHVRREQSRVGVTCSACRPCNRSDAFQIVVRVTHPSVAATADELTQRRWQAQQTELLSVQIELLSGWGLEAYLRR